MNGEGELLNHKRDALLRWARRKHYERLALYFAAIVFGLAWLFGPLAHALPGNLPPWTFPLLLAALVAPVFFYRRRWLVRDDQRTLAQFDRTLNLDARALTAWDLQRRADQSAAAQLVYRAAAAKLHAVEPRTLLPRQWKYADTIAPALFLLWLGGLWLDGGAEQRSGAGLQRPQSLAQRLREYARDLQEQAKSEGLKESLKAGQELEKLAQEKSKDDQLKAELAGMKQKLAEAAKATAAKDLPAAGESRQNLRDLKAELDAARDMLQLGDANKLAENLPANWMERLAGLPQLQKQLDQAAGAGQGLGQKEIKSLLERMDQQVSNELDRRALLDAQQFLEQLSRQGPGNKQEGQQMIAGRGEQEADGEGRREKNQASAPGKEAGAKNEDAKTLPEYRGGAPTQLKGQLGEGESRGVVFKGQPQPGKSEIAAQALAATYRRQAERELNSERVPEAVKETVRRYFMSLEESAKK